MQIVDPRTVVPDGAWLIMATRADPMATRAALDHMSTIDRVLGPFVADNGITVLFFHCKEGEKVYALPLWIIATKNRTVEGWITYPSTSALSVLELGIDAVEGGADALSDFVELAKRIAGNIGDAAENTSIVIKLLPWIGAALVVGGAVWFIATMVK